MVCDRFHKCPQPNAAAIRTRGADREGNDAGATNPPRMGNIKGGLSMAFFNSAVGVLQTLVVALGAGLGIWGAINLLEGYGNDNPGANAHG